MHDTFYHRVTREENIITNIRKST